MIRKIQKANQKYKIAITCVTVGTVCALTYFCKVGLGTSIVFTHLYYIPIFLAALWWKRKGLVVPLFLGVFLIQTNRLFHSEAPITFDYLRAIMFMVNGLVVTFLSEQIDKVYKIITIEREKLRSLALRLSVTEEKQRQHIAAGLHDSVGQKLSAAKIIAQTLKKKNMTENSDYLDKVIEYLESSIIEIRGLIFKLSPKVQYELGLNAAVESLIESFEQESSLKFHYKYTGSANLLNQKINTIIFRIIRELIINVIKHANAQNVYIDTEVNEDILKVVIEDDGCGFNVPLALDCDNNSCSFGLFSIQQQLLDVDGQIIIESEADSGTKVTILYPLETTGRKLTNAGNYTYS